VSPARRLFRAALIALSLGATPALATHYVVDINGGGDFTSIQVAVDANFDIEYRDTILIMPGDYNEALTRVLAKWDVYIVSTMGPLVTRTSSAAGFGGMQTRIEGLTFTAPMSIHDNINLCYFYRCAFRSPLWAYVDAGIANIEDCDFYAGGGFGGYLAWWYYPPFRKLRFHGGTMYTWLVGDGPAVFEDCTFEGPADVLVDANGGSDDFSFFGCHFANASTGIVFHIGYLADAYVGGCTFTDIAETGILLDGGGDGAPYGDCCGDGMGFGIWGSRFERCGTAVRWVGRGEYGGPAAMGGDTILASRHDGVVIGSNRRASFNEVIVDGSGGSGVAIVQDSTDAGDPWRAEVTNSTFTNNAGDGLRLEGVGQSEPQPWQWPARSHFSGSSFSHNGGAGLRVTGGLWDIGRCVSFDNRGDGFAINSTLASGTSLVGNTSVLNRGDGFRVTGPASPGDSLQFIRNNLAAMNVGAGLRVPHYAFGSLAHNDAWNNYAGQYVGPASPADSNLTIDPRFCDLSAGLTGLGLQQGAPCGADGVYGLIGARPEECANVTAVTPPVPRALAFAVRPTVARGSVEFVPPSSGPEGRVEVFDLSGRRIWGAEFGPRTGAVRWRGESDAGHARAGLYWVRFTRAGESDARRLVWLE
jgi:hypothetical protein